MSHAITRMARKPVDSLADLGKQLRFYGSSIAAIPKTLRRYRSEILRLIAEVSLGTGALAVIGGTVVVLGFLTVAASYEVGQQGDTSLGRIGIGALSGFVSAFFNTREAVPLIAGIALTATVGAGFTAELGAMRVSEEIDALEVMSVPSTSFLVTTRLIAGVIAVIPLYAIALIMGYASTRVVAMFFSGQSSGTYDHYFNVFLIHSDVWWSLLKVIVMAVVIMCVTCYHGYNASGGPAGVGVAVGRAVRTSLIAVMVIDLLVGIAVFGGPGAGVHISG
ncbi:MlaE family ABC transporter permease [Tomitella biformata]|uniref:MlaE family ABC transporter permease n=1 Tax=Tomitella biformata TaxID=630403 RepID=UPI0004B7D216|nr:ABC transporter permease [Tomitella biformata]